MASYVTIGKMPHGYILRREHNKDIPKLDARTLEASERLLDALIEATRILAINGGNADKVKLYHEIIEECRGGKRQKIQYDIN